MSSKQIVLYPTTQEQRDALPMVSDVQFMDKFASTAINQKFAGVFQSGVYRGFDVVDSGNGVVTVAGSAEGDTAIVNLAGNICMTVNAQSAINVQLEADVSYTLVLNAFYEHGTTTTQVDSTSQIPPASLSLIPYGTESSEQVVLADVQWDGVGAVVIDVNRRQNGSPLNVYSKDHVDTVLSAMSEAESIAIRKAKHAKFAASDFIYHGKNSALAGTRVNEGLTAYGAASVEHINQFYLGPAHSSQSGDSPTVMPVFNMGGAEIPFSAFVDRFPFKLPPAEKGYRTYNSNGGESINFLTELAGYDALPLSEDEAKIRAFYSGIDIDSMTVNDGQTQIDRFTATSVDSGGYISFYSHTPLVVGRKYYVDFEIIGTLNGTTRVDIASAVGGQYGVGRHKVTIENAGATSNFIRVHGDGAGANFTLKLHEAREATVSVVKNRVDLSTLEIYQEESTDGEIFPFFIQSEASDVIDGVPMILSKRPKSYFAQYEGQYDIPEELNDEFYCWDWPSLTFAQKKLVAQYLGETLFMGKNGYLVQDRVRARTFAGNGNGDWAAINVAAPSTYAGTLQFSSTAWVNAVHPIGVKNTFVENGEHRYNPSYSSNPELTQTGMYLARVTYGYGYDSKCYMYVVTTTPRLNAAGWHPSYNPMGACTLDLDSSVFGSQVEITSFLDCCLNATNGDIASGVSGRPDGKYFDAIYPSGEGGIVDHRLKYGAWDASSAEQAATVRGEVIGSVYRGREKLVKTVIDKNGFRNTSDLSYYTSAGHHRLSCHLGVLGIDGFGDWSCEKHKQHVIVINNTTQTYTWLYNEDRGHSEIYWMRVHPNSPNTPAEIGLVTNTTYSSGEYTVIYPDYGIIGITVEGEFNTLNVVATLDELTSNPLLKDGFIGSWIDITPDGTAQDVPMTRKSLDSQLGYSLSVDGGASWTSGDTATFNDVENGISLSLTATDVGIYDYTAFAKQTEQSSNLAAFNGMKGMGEVFNTQSYAKEWGVLLFESTLCEVSKVAYGGGKTVMQHQALQGVSIEVDGKVSSKSGQPPYAEPTKLTAGEKALRVLTHQIKENGQANINFIANELIYDETSGDWGDSGEIKVSVSSSFTDHNGNVCKSDIHKLAKPYGWIKDKV